MTRMTITLSALLIAATLFIAQAVLACDTCGCQDTGAAVQACDCPDGQCTCPVADAPEAKPMDCTMCPEGACTCGMGVETDARTGAMPVVKTVATGHDMPATHVASPEGLNIELREVEPFDVAYMATTMSSDVAAVFTEMLDEAMSQGVMYSDSQVGSTYHGDLFEEPTEDSVFHAAVTIAKDVELNAPLQRETVPGGQYMVVQHYGDYQNLPVTYGAVITWVAANGMEFGDGPSFEHYISDPGSTPMEEWLTEIYLPFPHAAEHAH